MVADVPASGGPDEAVFPPSLLSTAQHIELLYAKEQRLEEARREAQEQFFHSIGAAYRTGEISDRELIAIYRHVKDAKVPRSMTYWNASVGLTWQKVVSLMENLPNGPEGSWVGEWPHPRGAPLPINGIPVVYVLYDAANEPVYVGSTGKFRLRMTQHVDQGKEFVYWQAHRCRDREHAYEVEVRLLGQRLPRLNFKVGR
jgi:hypothetical protein